MNPDQNRSETHSPLLDVDDIVVGARTMDRRTITTNGDNNKVHDQLGERIGIRQQQQISTSEEDEIKVALPFHHLFLGDDTLLSLGSKRSIETKVGEDIEPEKPRVAAAFNFDKDTQLSFPQKVCRVMKTIVAVLAEKWYVLMPSPSVL
jgi:hypothetical protein